MTKKKAIKVIAASAIAASSFAAVAPNNADAASKSISTQVKESKTTMRNAMVAYYDAPNYVKASVMEKHIQKAKDSYNKTKANVKKSKYSYKQRLAWVTDLTKTYKKYVGNAVKYQNAIKAAYAAKLDILKQLEAANAAVTAKDLAKAEEAVAAINKALEDQAYAIKAGVVGAAPEGHVLAAYNAPLAAQAETLVAEVAKLKEELATPAVQSVSAINAKEIKVTFNKDVNTASAELEANYKIYKNNDTTELTNTNETVFKAVSIDSKTVILQLVTPLKNNETYAVNVDGVLSSEYKQVNKYTGTVSVFNDKANAQLLSSSVAGNQLSLEFNEPVSINAIKIDGLSPAAVNPVPTDAGDYVYKFTLTNAQATVGTHNVVLYGVADLAGNESSLMNATYNVSLDNSTPAVQSVTPVGTASFDVKFNTSLAALTNSNFVISKGTHTFTAGSDFTVAPVPNKVNTYRVTFATAILNDAPGVLNPVYAKNETTSNITFQVKDFKGSNNNFGTNYTGSVVLTKDTQGPTVQSSAVNFTEAGNLVVVFDQEINTSTGNITIVKDGVQIKSAAANTFATVDTNDNKRLVINPGVALTDGTYEVYLAEGAVVDRDPNLNKNVAQNTTVKSSLATTYYTTAPTVTPTVVNGQNVLTVSFGTTKMADSARDLANYKLDGVPLNDSIYAGAVAVFTDGDKDTVKITLPAGKHPVSPSETKALEFSKNIKTDAGLTVAKDTTGKVQTVNVAITDDVAPKLVSAEYVKASSTATSSQLVKLTFDENVKITGDIADDVTLTLGNTTVTGTVVDAQYGGTANDKELYFTLTTPVNVAQTGTVNLVGKGVYNSEIGILDIVNNKAVATTVTLSNSIVDSSAAGQLSDQAAASEVQSKITAATGQAQIEAARSAYNSLTTAQKALVTNEATLQTKEQGLATTEAGNVAATLAVTTGNTTLPTVAAGYTIAVKTTSDNTKYDSTGLGVAAGTSTVVYTVTHTASGKTADTADVTVTVAP